MGTCEAKLLRGAKTAGGAITVKQGEVPVMQALKGRMTGTLPLAASRARVRVN
jgi:hypothetical protein